MSSDWEALMRGFGMLGQGIGSIGGAIGENRERSVQRTEKKKEREEDVAFRNKQLGAQQFQHQMQLAEDLYRSSFIRNAITGEAKFDVKLFTDAVNAFKLPKSLYAPWLEQGKAISSAESQTKIDADLYSKYATDPKKSIPGVPFLQQTLNAPPAPAPNPQEGMSNMDLFNPYFNPSPPPAVSSTADPLQQLEQQKEMERNQLLRSTGVRPELLGQPSPAPTQQQPNNFLINWMRQLGIGR